MVTGSGSSAVFVQVIILIGNKADLEAQRDVTYEEAKQFAEENGEPRRVTWRVTWRRWPGLTCVCVHRSAVPGGQR